MNTAAVPAWLPTPLTPLFSLSYPTNRPPQPDAFPASNFYNIGLLDGWMLVSMIAFMAIARDISRIYLLEPFARWKLMRDMRHGKRLLGPDEPSTNGTANGNGHTNGTARHGKSASSKASRREMKELNRRVLRFAEQGWQVIYYVYQWSMGLYVYKSLPSRIFSTDTLWIGYPHIPLPGPVKFYYLTQTAFYIHGVLLLNAEARRKDHWQMMIHHVITITLMVCSYFYNFTRVGCMIMVLMDWCDIWLPLAKMLRYISFRTLCDGAFGVFLVSWAVTRHFFFGLVIWSTYNAPALIPHNWIPEQKYWFTKQVWMVFVGMLLSLQVIQVMWFWMICAVAYRVLSGKGAEDVRSDDEGDDDEAKED